MDSTKVDVPFECPSAELEQLTAILELEGKRLQHGSFGIIHTCKFKGEIAAVKIVKKDKMDCENHNPLNEANVWKLVGNHPNIVALFDVIETQTCLSFVMEIGEIDLWYFSEKIEERLKRPLSIQITEGLKYLHSLSILHRDLKTENIIVFNSKQDILVKITDFGNSVILEGDSLCTETTGTIETFAPEQARMQPYGYPSDYWKLGMVILQLVDEKCGFPKDVSPQSHIRNLRKNPPVLPSRWTRRLRKISNPFRDVIYGLLCFDPNKRTTPVEVLNLLGGTQ